MTIEIQSRNNFLIQPNIVAFQFIIQELLSYLFQKDQSNVETKQALEASRNKPQDIIKVYRRTTTIENQNIATQLITTEALLPYYQMAQKQLDL